jgi:drug/metabolite transporter (DMT)-like permease
MPKDTMEPNRKHAIVAIVTTVAIWGVATPIIKVTLNYIPPFSFLLIRFILASFILYFLVDWKKGYLKHLGKKGFVYAFLIGALGSSVNLGLYFWGVNFTTSFEATVIYSSAPIFIVLGGALLLKEHVSQKEFLGLLIALCGFALIAFRPIFENGSNLSLNFKGNVLVFLAVIAWTAYSLFSKFIFNGDKSGEKFSPMFVTFVTFFAGAITLIPFGIYEIMTVDINYAKAAPGILYMTIAATVVAYALYEYAVKTIDVSETAIFQYLQPVFTLPLSLVFLGEPFSPVYIVGGILVAGGVFLSEHHPVKIKRK